MNRTELSAAITAYRPPPGVTVTGYPVPIRDENRNIIFTVIEIMAEVPRPEQGEIVMRQLRSTEPIELLPVGLVPVLCAQAVAPLGHEIP
jgi:hypothetical protein